MSRFRHKLTIHQESTIYEIMNYLLIIVHFVTITWIFDAFGIYDD